MVSIGAGISGGASIGASVGGAVGAVAGAAIGVAVSVMSGGVPAMIRCTDPTALGLVLFDFNPNQIVFSRMAQGSNRPSPNSGSSGYILSMTTPPKIQLKQVVFTGETTKLRVDQLVSWAGPPGRSVHPARLDDRVPDLVQPAGVHVPVGPAVGRLHVLRGHHERQRDLHPLPHQRHPDPGRAEPRHAGPAQPARLDPDQPDLRRPSRPEHPPHARRRDRCSPSLSSTIASRVRGARSPRSTASTDPHRVRLGTTVFLPNESEF